MLSWEYQTISIPVLQRWGGSKGTLDNDALNHELNCYGIEGWELVGLCNLQHTAGSASILCVFKRAQNTGSTQTPSES